MKNRFQNVIFNFICSIGSYIFTWIIVLHYRLIIHTRKYEIACSHIFNLCSSYSGVDPSICCAEIE